VLLLLGPLTAPPERGPFGPAPQDPTASAPYRTPKAKSPQCPGGPPASPPLRVVMPALAPPLRTNPTCCGTKSCCTPCTAAQGRARCQGTAASSSSSSSCATPGPSVSFFLGVDALSAPGRDGRRDHGTEFPGPPGRVSGTAWRRYDGVGATSGEPQAPSETGPGNKRPPPAPSLPPSLPPGREKATPQPLSSKHSDLRQRNTGCR
jgi:hypothetical protein